VSLDDLAPIDEFHIRGWEATKELAEEIGLHAEKLVLDIGWGLGGDRGDLPRNIVVE
jgi:MPBQ/MSBQ methyltransferase